MTAALASVRLSEVLQAARTANASDIHLCAGKPPVLRIDGRLKIQSTIPSSEPEIAELLALVLDAAARERLRTAGDVSVTYSGREIGSVRIHAYSTIHGPALAFRLLSESIPELESLRLPKSVIALTNRERGLVIVAGPTGSGKSTILAAMVDRIARERSKHIITVEDPVEYRLRSDASVVSQREVGRDVPSFAEAVTGALRSDPDVILLGEMREREAMHAALTAAETGHLVLTTLHTGDAPQTVDRIVASFEGAMQEQVRAQLSQTLLGVVCVRLVPRRAGGRICAAEVLLATDAVRHLIRTGKTHQLRNVISTGRQFGMQTLESHLSELVDGGVVAGEEAAAVTDRPGELPACERRTD